MITMTEIAKMTGVSQPTVSRVLSGNKSVNPDIRKRVLDCARKYGFQPNSIAQSLVGNKTHLIGVVVTDLSNAFFADLIKNMEQEARKAGYSLILFNSDYDREHEEECLDVVQRYHVDGLIAVPVDEDSRLWKEHIRRLGIPTVVLTRKAEGLDSVYVDHAEAGRQVGRHLLSQGYEEFIFFGDKSDVKYEGFVAALQEGKVDTQKRLSDLATKDSRQVRAFLEAHFQEKNGRTGIFAYNDRRAVHMMGLLQQLGIEIPKRAGLVGFDNTFMCDYLFPRLTSVSQPNNWMAALAVQRLLYRIANPKEQGTVDHPLTAGLVIRDSSVV